MMVFARLPVRIGYVVDFYSIAQNKKYFSCASESNAMHKEKIADLILFLTYFGTD